jgi:predicted N-formylglutamate amidohydrolase
MNLLAPDEPAPFEIYEPRPARRPIVFVCDHAANRVPRSLGALGLDPRQLQEHIAWDIGAGGVARRLIERFDARGVLAVYSRLAVDLNRDLGDGSAFPALSGGVLVPGNLGLSRTAKAERARRLYDPYHAAVAAALDRIGARAALDRIDARAALERLDARADADPDEGADADPAEDSAPVLIAIHSFTPRMHGVARPWHIGVLWDKDPRLAVPLLAALRARAGVLAGDNEPYSGRHPADYTIDHHAEPRGIAHASIEIRQDLIRDEAGQREWAERLAAALAPVLEDDALYRRRRPERAEASRADAVAGRHRVSFAP